MTCLVAAALVVGLPLAGGIPPALAKGSKASQGTALRTLPSWPADDLAPGRVGYLETAPRIEQVLVVAVERSGRACGFRTAPPAAGEIRATGAFVGGAIGKTMEETDRRCVLLALEHGADGEAVAWTNPATGNSYEITVVKTFVTIDGRRCRVYGTRADTGKAFAIVYGTACREENGAWRFVSR